MSVATIGDSRLLDMGDCMVPDPKLGDFRLNVHPFEWLGYPVELPEGFGMWTETVNAMLRCVPVQRDACRHFVTIDSRFFAVADTLRREGVHVDGNFCVDPLFQGASWGGTTWADSSIEGGRVLTPWVSPYGIYPPVGRYVSGSHGGILCVSSYPGCRVWSGDWDGEVASEGSCEHIGLPLDDSDELEANRLYFMTSNTPHETLPIPAGVRRTLIRVTLDHRYENDVIQASKGVSTWGSGTF